MGGGSCYIKVYEDVPSSVTHFRAMGLYNKGFCFIQISLTTDHVRVFLLLKKCQHGPFDHSCCKKRLSFSSSFAPVRLLFLLYRCTSPPNSGQGLPSRGLGKNSSILLPSTTNVLYCAVHHCCTNLSVKFERTTRSVSVKNLYTTELFELKMTLGMPNPL